MKQRAFTLIELLVVIAIIGILATVVLTSLGSARERARDARRQSDIRTIQQALEVYYLDNGQYPPGYNNATSSSNSPTQWTSFETALGVDLPEDPTNEIGGSSPNGYLTYTYANYPNSSIYCYGRAYMLIYNLETEDNTTDGVTLCNGGTYGYSGAFVVGVSPQN